MHELTDEFTLTRNSCRDTGSNYKSYLDDSGNSNDSLFITKSYKYWPLYAFVLQRVNAYNSHYTEIRET